MNTCIVSVGHNFLWASLLNKQEAKHVLKSACYQSMNAENY